MSTAISQFRFYGWKRQPKDKRDLRLITPKAAAAKLPTSFDLSPRMGPQLDQEDLGSCGPNSEAECLDFDQIVQGLKMIAPSRLFMYYTARQVMGKQYLNQDSGVDNRSMLKALNKYGYVPESVIPYDTNKFTKAPTAAQYKAALANAITNYAAVQQTLPQMQGCIAGGRPFIFGFDCFPGLESAATARTGIVPDPKKGESTIGGHDVSFVAFNATGKALPGVLHGNVFPPNTFKFRNHWINEDGSPWGDGGYGYLSFKYSTDTGLSGDFWTINAVSAK